MIRVHQAYFFLTLVIGIAIGIRLMEVPARAQTEINGIPNQALMMMPVRFSTTTVSALPTCTASLVGRAYIVTDGSAVPTLLATVTGGASTYTPVFCNGSAWKIF